MSRLVVAEGIGLARRFTLTKATAPSWMLLFTQVKHWRHLRQSPCYAGIRTTNATPTSMQPCLNLHATAQPLNGLFPRTRPRPVPGASCAAPCTKRSKNTRAFCFRYAGAAVCHGKRDVIGPILQSNGKLPARHDP